jgi:hypothetical protein
VAQQTAWQSTQDRLNDFFTYCQGVAGNLDTMSYAEKRHLLMALDVEAQLYRTDHSPRWEITADFDGIVDRTAFSSCSGGPIGKLTPLLPCTQLPRLRNATAGTTYGATGSDLLAATWAIRPEGPMLRGSSSSNRLSLSAPSDAARTVSTD